MIAGELLVLFVDLRARLKLRLVGANLLLNPSLAPVLLAMATCAPFS
jgi:hypothetical protein